LSTRHGTHAGGPENPEIFLPQPNKSIYKERKSYLGQVIHPARGREVICVGVVTLAVILFYGSVPVIGLYQVLYMYSPAFYTMTTISIFIHVSKGINKCGYGIGLIDMIHYGV
jgi:hypothetical protein